MSSEEHRREPDQKPDQEPASETENSEEDASLMEEPQGSASDPASDGEPLDEAPDPAYEILAEDAPEDDAASEEELVALSAELETTRRERDEYLDSLRRLKAEFENSRKRQERERERILQSASENLVAELLPVLDNLERALEVEGDVKDGVRATLGHFVDVLGREGLVSVASDGESFDPNVHEAVMSQPSEEHEEGTILQTFQRGYVLNGKPIRPAKVVVSRQV